MLVCSGNQCRPLSAPLRIRFASSVSIAVVLGEFEDMVGSVMLRCILPWPLTSRSFAQADSSVVAEEEGAQPLSAAMMSLNKYAFASMTVATACVYHAFNTRCGPRARTNAPLPIRCFQPANPTCTLGGWVRRVHASRSPRGSGAHLDWRTNTPHATVRHEKITLQSRWGWRVGGELLRIHGNDGPTIVVPTAGVR